MQKITPCLWFDNNGEEAINLIFRIDLQVFSADVFEPENAPLGI
jgi:predicted 3-demethylubiquinone-9 3-methyltransferase (glyoxalase superfamily)